MLEYFLLELYITDLTYIVIAIPFFLIIWSVISAVINKRIMVLATLVTVLSMVAILYVTLAKREQGNLSYDLIPFSSFQRANEQPEMYRSMLMNVFLFVPLGMSLVFVVKGSIFKRILLTMLVGFLLSASVETVQFFLSLGMAETDDVICNTVGTLVGSTAYSLSLLWRRIIGKHRKGSTDGQGA